MHSHLLLSSLRVLTSGYYVSARRSLNIKLILVRKHALSLHSPIEGSRHVTAELLKNRSCGDQYEQLKYQGADLVVVISSQGQTM